MEKTNSSLYSITSVCNSKWQSTTVSHTRLNVIQLLPKLPQYRTVRSVQDRKCLLDNYIKCVKDEKMQLNED